MAAGEINTLPYCGACGWDLNKNMYNDILCDACGQDARFNVTVPVPPLATGVNSGAPGDFTPSGSRAAANFAQLVSDFDPPNLGSRAYWASGEYVVCINDDEGFWDATQWVAGRVPFVDGEFVSIVQTDTTVQECTFTWSAVVPPLTGSGLWRIQFSTGDPDPSSFGSVASNIPATDRVYADYVNALGAGVCYDYWLSAYYESQPYYEQGEKMSLVWTDTSLPLAAYGLHGETTGNFDPESYGRWSATTPAGSPCKAPLFSELGSVAATPATAWVTGNHILTVDLVEVYWDGAAWQTGIAP